MRLQPLWRERATLPVEHAECNSRIADALSDLRGDLCGPSKARYTLWRDHVTKDHPNAGEDVARSIWLAFHLPLDSTCAQDGRERCAVVPRPERGRR